MATARTRWARWQWPRNWSESHPRSKRHVQDINPIVDVYVLSPFGYNTSLQDVRAAAEGGNNGIVSRNEVRRLSQGRADGHRRRDRRVSSPSARLADLRARRHQAVGARLQAPERSEER